MGILRKQIGWSQESNLLWEILRQLNKLAGAIFNLKPKYKVYTALLTQSGGDNSENFSGGNLTIGETYQILSGGGPSGDWDFTNVGAPNNDFNTWFVATGTTPNSWGYGVVLFRNLGAPVVTVLENTIGNIWFTYDSTGLYYINSTNLFTENKTWAVINTPNYDSNQVVLNIGRITNNQCSIYSSRLTSPVGQFLNIDTNGDEVSIEIRVYN